MEIARAAGYAWGLAKPIIPILYQEDIELAFAAYVFPAAADPMAAYWEAVAADGEIIRLFAAFERGVRDAIPLYVDDARESGASFFNLGQLEAALDMREGGYLRRMVQRGTLKAFRNGKLWLVAPADFEAWAKTQRWASHSWAVGRKG